jgi:RimJ/RimL family protein N-acetyltransferase
MPTSTETLETERLILRRQTVEDAVVFRELWAERDPRVPPHRRIDATGHPTVPDVADHIRAQLADPRPGLLTVERRAEQDVIGYCGLVWGGNATDDEPELAFELLRSTHNRGYATEAATAVVDWARDAGYRRLRAGVWEWNIASRTVLGKLGFHEVGDSGPASEHGRNLLTVLEL